MNQLKKTKTENSSNTKTMDFQLPSPSSSSDGGLSDKTCIANSEMDSTQSRTRSCITYSINSISNETLTKKPCVEPTSLNNNQASNHSNKQNKNLINYTINTEKNVSRYPIPRKYLLNLFYDVK